MLDEKRFRRSDFRPGFAVPLADGQEWMFPPPPDSPGDERFGPDYVAAMEAVLEAEDRAELLRAELALAICLLWRNYDLGPEAYQELLGFAPGSPALAAAQQLFHELSFKHILKLEKLPEARSIGLSPQRVRGGALSPGRLGNRA